MKPVTEGPGLVAGVYLPGEALLALHPDEKCLQGEFLRRLRGSAIDDAYHHDPHGVDIQSQLDTRVRRVLGLFGIVRGTIRVSAVVHGRWRV